MKKNIKNMKKNIKNIKKKKIISKIYMIQSIIDKRIGYFITLLIL
jgi:hypothetical protein